ncbi:uncharacterized protein BP01DRAFT_405886 [Aspergillus saccharolyticus JOP 1030-1]|uniref:Atos-like conserved domain-containing protein n=1 Tax=Aspergillus saccharolyticus JOP 1030-1 TaxID=1450539 RepID=A0A318ZNA0_9EURO|nr:hypothetical protein BP01DRAFT_405886 [Aspergillus saccharolyticus JOP 1030-1]PYH48447.1 hypothetical protein BP01DRAFT_405886 [Aspergillus saccharolyticus JOP 1030-1]
MPIFQYLDPGRSNDPWSDDHSSGQETQCQTIASWECSQNTSSGVPLSASGKYLHPEGPSPSDVYDADDRGNSLRRSKNAGDLKWNFHRSADASHDLTPFTPEKYYAMRDQLIESISAGSQLPSSDQKLASPADIERPRSALHSGDFREGSSQNQSRQQPSQSPLPNFSYDVYHSPLSSSPTTPWFSTPVFPASVERQSSSLLATTPVARSRAPSLGSFSSSYILKAPTSPLVHQANITDFDYPPRPEHVGHIGFSDNKATRRRTLPPETFRDMQIPETTHGRGARLPPDPSMREWNSAMAHQFQPPKRSLTCGYSLQLASSVQTANSRSRRPSIGSEVSSRALAPMVGSYEESILRGRMSTNPSKPLDFTAQIGVLGKGKCKGSLKCPPHVTIPFPAVFYSYPTSGCGRSIADDSPSPYVGMIDLDSSLPKDTSSDNRRRKHHHHQSPGGIYNDQHLNSPLETRSNEKELLRMLEKRHRRAESPKSPPGGSYRIPQQGQLQVIIKNPNKTAVKLFLVPYDLTDMEPGTKTFIRQRSYSAGPTIDMPLSARKNYGTDRPEASLNVSEDPKDKPILRYLIHLNICCPSKGRFYLYSTIRVVFANRVPDGKEKLRNEIQFPYPRYSPYRASREAHHAHLNTVGEKRLRKSTPGHLTNIELNGSSEMSHPGCSSYFGCSPSTRHAASTRESSALRGGEDCHARESSTHPLQAYPLSGISQISPCADLPEKRQTKSGLYSKLHKGENGYVGYPSNGIDIGDSLLAQRLRGLDVHRHRHFQQHYESDADATIRLCPTQHDQSYR